MGAIGGVRKQAQLKYEKDLRTPDAAYLSALQRAGVDIQYVLTGFRVSDVPGAQEFMDRMNEAEQRTANIWRSHSMPEDDSLFHAMKGVRAVAGVTDAHLASLAQAIMALLRARTADADRAASVPTAAARIDEGLLYDAVRSVEEFAEDEDLDLDAEETTALIVRLYMHYSPATGTQERAQEQRGERVLTEPMDVKEYLRTIA
jgi:hypothetical protein